MDASIIVAVVALVGAVFSAGISVYGQARSTSLARRREAEGVLAKYREPLVAAAYELQGRLYNILELDFLQKYYLNGDDAQRRYAVKNTLYVVGQYFAWSEILRREIQFLSFSDSARSRAVADCQRKIVEAFQSDDDSLGRPFLIWRGEQRAIGELMIDKDAAPAQCIGYAEFLERKEDSFAQWFARLESDIDELATIHNRRIYEIQNALVELIAELDREQTRYPPDTRRPVSPPAGAE